MNAAGVGNPSLDLNPDLTAPTNIGHYPAFGAYNSGGNSSQLHANFGQKPFKYEPSQGFLPLNSATVRPNKVIPRPDQYVGVTTYTGNASNHAIVVGLKPDLVWIKSRDATRNHRLTDTVQGAGKEIYSDILNTEGTVTDGVTSFTDNGFVLGANNNYNYTEIMWLVLENGGSKGTFNIDDVAYASASATELDGDQLLPLVPLLELNKDFQF